MLGLSPSTCRPLRIRWYEAWRVVLRARGGEGGLLPGGSSILRSVGFVGQMKWWATVWSTAWQLGHVVCRWVQRGGSQRRPAMEEDLQMEGPEKIYAPTEVWSKNLPDSGP